MCNNIFTLFFLIGDWRGDEREGVEGITEGFQDVFFATLQKILF